MRREFKLSVTPRFYVFMAAFLVAVPLPWIAGFVLATAVHELGHCLALCLCGKEIRQIHVDISGAQIHTEEMDEPEAVCCALAGPLAQLILLMFARVFPQMALCAFAQCLFNLLPVCPLDGGQALQSLTRVLFREDIADRLCRIVGILTVTCVVGGAVFFFASVKMLVLSVACGVFFCIRIMHIKRPCK